MFRFLMLLFPIMIAAIFLGLINPKLVIRWGDEDSKTRGNVLKFYGIGTIAVFILMFVLLPSSEDDLAETDDLDTDIESELIEEEPEEFDFHESDKSILELSYNSLESEQKDRIKAIKENLDKVPDADKEFVESNLDRISQEKDMFLAEKESERKERELKNKQKNMQEIIETSNFRVNTKVAATYFIEEFEKQRIKKVNINNVAVYSSDIIKDKAGERFEYSFMATGRYEEKGTGALRDFAMTLAYKNYDDLEEGNARCVQYFNDDTGTVVNAMSEEDDILLKLE